MIKAILDKNTRVHHSRGKNKSHFCIYTPLEYSKEIIDVSLNLYFSLGKDYKEIYKKKKINLEEVKVKLENLKAVDLACGDGNLLVILLEELIELSKVIYGKYRFIPSWISGYDIDNQALLLLKNRVEETLEKYQLIDEFKDILETLNFKNRDSLLVSEEKYNLILGNPPYFGEKNHKEIFDKIKESHFGKRYYEAKMDYLYFFIEKGIELLEKDGILTYITTNYWLRADSGKKLRDCIKENSNLCYMNNINKSVFEYAPGQHNLIFSLKKIEKLDFKGLFNKNNNKKIEENIVFIRNEKEEYTMEIEELYDLENKIVLCNLQEKEFSKKLLEKRSFFLEEKFNINQGIVTGLDKAFIFSECADKYKEYLKPLYKNKDIDKYAITKKNQFWILYLSKKANLPPILEEHLKQYYEKLCKRREVKIGVRNWWELIWPRDEKIFKEPSIVVRQRCKSNVFAYSDGDFYGSADIYYITAKVGICEDEEEILFYTLGYLNSKIFYEWYKINGKSKGPNMEFYSKPLQKTPIIYPKDNLKVKKIVELVKQQIKFYSEDKEILLNKCFNNILENIEL